jgi:hypothetical protein
MYAFDVPVFHQKVLISISHYLDAAISIHSTRGRDGQADENRILIAFANEFLKFNFLGNLKVFILGIEPRFLYEIKDIRHDADIFWDR